MAPTLCRLPAYCGPGLPSPTTSQGPVAMPFVRHTPDPSRTTGGSALAGGLAGGLLDHVALRRGLLTGVRGARGRDDDDERLGVP